MKRIVLLLLAMSLLALPGGATWSIVVLNTRTGEVAVGTATCVANEDLEEWVPVVVVGLGAGASQAWVAADASNRIRIRDGLVAGLTPQEILDDIIENDYSPGRRQFGIVGFTGPSVTFSGHLTDEGLTNRAGQRGELWYAIQGNVLTGEAVGQAAESALLKTEGDLGQRLMAAMEAARAYGGDGRCSCVPHDPTRCGCPPGDFKKSAHCGCVFVARIGDVDGACNPTVGCADGDYYLGLSTTGSWAHPEPIFVLQDMYDQWRAGLAGRPDHILSTVSVPVQSLPADGCKQTVATVELVDVDGVPLASGGAMIHVTAEDEAVATAGVVTDHGNGTYSFPVTAGLVPGTARFVITADDGVARATLYPFLELRVDAATPLHVGRDTISVSAGAEVPLTLNLPGAGGEYYIIIASTSGTQPGIWIGDVLLPLNPDEIFWRSIEHANNNRFQRTLGQLDAAGRAEALFSAPPHLLNNLIGRRMDWAALYYDPELQVTNAGGFDISF